MEISRTKFLKHLSSENTSFLSCVVTNGGVTPLHATWSWPTQYTSIYQVLLRARHGKNNEEQNEQSLPQGAYNPISPSSGHY